jgi:penicillin amidase
MKQFFRYIAFFAILLFGVIGLAYYWTIVRPQPDYEATIELPGLNESVTIYWDEYGVPHIFATNEEDLYFAVGYVHAQDRLWQLTLQQLVLEGRFAEFFGADALPIDRFNRTMGFMRTAKQIEAETSAEQMKIYQAYSEGINQYITLAGNQLPIEYSLTGITPWEWTPAHSIGVTRLMGWELNVGWWSKVMLGYLENRLPEDQLKALIPEWPRSGPTSQDSTLLSFLDSELSIRSILNNKGTGVGSNAWVVDGSKSQTGYPILAGDPHLGLDMPGFWYEIHMNLSGKNVSGATIAGAPFVVLGQNDQLAWSFTSLMADNTDFFQIDVNPLDRSQYVSDSMTSFTYIRELIKTKEGAQEALEIRMTEFGPIINDIYPNKALVEGQLLALRWSGQDVSHEGLAIYRINWSTSFQEFQDALAGFGVPGLNMVYGDRTGNIGLFTIGNQPVRRDPLRLRNAADPLDHWTGFIPYADLPKIINPASGFISNANNPPVKDYVPYLTAFWEPEARQQRITEVLSEKKRFTVADFEALQNDVLSVSARELTPLILPALQTSEDTLIMAAIPYLLNWDYRFTTSATAASIFESFFMNLTRNTFLPILGDAAYDNFIRMQNLPTRLISHHIKQGQVSDEVIIASMKQTLDDLVARFGTEPVEWRWENLHQITLDPPLFREAAQAPGASGVLKVVLNNVLSKGPYPVPGHSRTVNNGQYDWHNPYEMTLGPSIRRIVDLSDLRTSRSVLPTGQSGNPLGTHFGDQTWLWISGKTRIFHHSSTISDADGIRTMTLHPATTK